jgi:hypothetical protein
VPLDPPDQCVQHIGHGSKGDSFNLPLIEHYRQGCVGVEVWGRFRSVKVKPRYWRAFFHGIKGEFHPGWGSLSIVPPPHLIYVKNTGDDEQESMLVDDAQSVKDPERAVGIDPAFPVWSSVWLACFEGVEDARVIDLRNESCSIEIALLIEGRLANGEICVVPRLLAVEQYELPRQVVERGPEVVKDFAQKQAPIGRDHGNVMDGIDVLRNLSVVLKAKSVCVRPHDPGDFAFQIGKLALCPLDLAVNAAQISGTHALPLEADAAGTEATTDRADPEGV